MPAPDSVGDVCRLDRRKTVSGMDAAWLAAAPHQDQEERTCRMGANDNTTHTRSESKSLPAQMAGAPKGANYIFERALES